MFFSFQLFQLLRMMPAQYLANFCLQRRVTANTADSVNHELLNLACRYRLRWTLIPALFLGMGAGVVAVLHDVMPKTPSESPKDQ